MFKFEIIMKWNRIFCCLITFIGFSYGIYGQYGPDIIKNGKFELETKLSTLPTEWFATDSTLAGQNEIRSKNISDKIKTQYLSFTSIKASKNQLRKSYLFTQLSIPTSKERIYKLSISYSKIKNDKNEKDFPLQIGFTNRDPKSLTNPIYNLEFVEIPLNKEEKRINKDIEFSLNGDYSYMIIGNFMDNPKLRKSKLIYFENNSSYEIYSISLQRNLNSSQGEILAENEFNGLKNKVSPDIQNQLGLLRVTEGQGLEAKKISFKNLDKIQKDEFKGYKIDRFNAINTNQLKGKLIISYSDWSKTGIKDLSIYYQNKLLGQLNPKQKELSIDYFVLAGTTVVDSKNPYLILSNEDNFLCIIPDNPPVKADIKVKVRLDGTKLKESNIIGQKSLVPIKINYQP